MRIAIFTNNYLPNPYGVAGSIESFRKELEKNGHTVYIFAPKTKGYTDKNANVFRYPAIDFNFKDIHFPIAIPFSLRLNKILKKLEIDIVHSQHPNLLGWEAKRWAKKKNVPLVFTWHTLYDKYAHFNPFLPSKISAWLAIRNARNYANSADQIIVPTLSVKEIIEKWGVKNEFITNIPTGVEEQLYQSYDRNIYRKKFGIKDAEIVLVCISRLTVEKNVQFLMESAIEVLKNQKKAKFILAGAGSEINILKEMAAKSGLLDRIFFLGIVSKEDVKNIYAAGDIFVFASKSETQGMIVSEAMYIGLPVVALDATGVKDLIINNSTGFLVKEDKKEFAVAVKRLLEDEKLRLKFSENARELAHSKYTSFACAKKLLETYERLIKK